MASTQWDMAALGRVIGTHPNVVEEVDRATRVIHGTASALSADFRTGKFHPDHKSPGVGDTPASYEGNVQVLRNSVVGLVYTANYAAQKDNAQNNTLLKSIG